MGQLWMLIQTKSRQEDSKTLILQAEYAANNKKTHIIITETWAEAVKLD